MDAPTPTPRRQSPDAGSHVASAAQDTLLYTGHYLDLVIAARSASGPVTLVAGVHTARFPYVDTSAWDNCLLLVGEEGYTFTAQGEAAGQALAIDFDVEAERTCGFVRFEGSLRRVRDGVAVAAAFEWPVALVRFPVRRLAEAYNLLRIDGLIGMRWNPWVITGSGEGSLEVGVGQGRLRIAGRELLLDGIRGSCERGVLTNLRAHDFAIRYDYLATACPGEDGYGLIGFTSHALYPASALGEILDLYLARTASATLTLSLANGDASLEEGNSRGVATPAHSDAAALLFEDVVDLGLARLHRQMIRTHDASGRALHGLREIFIANPAEAPPLLLARRSVRRFLGALVVALAAALGYWLP